jgi:subtilase family serine protease
LAGCSGGDLGALDEPLVGVSNAAVCPGPAAPGDARCHARVVIDAMGRSSASTPSGYVPDDLRAAYAIPASTSTALVAIVDAYDNPNAENDLNVYRQQFGIPPCTTANGCFQKVNQSGVAGSYPRGDVNWGQEIDLDLDMVSASCPSCRILLVEAKSASMSDLGAAVNTAVALGANVVSNSYGGNKTSNETSQEASFFDHPGVAITASSGDSGYGAQFPASSRYVTAVGGTHLVKGGGGRGWSESAWSGAGSGCSAYITKPSWQADSGCARRTVADVSAVADPNTGVAVYDSYGRHNSTGWMVFGGTSVASPLVAGVFGVANNGADPSVPYAHPSALFDVVGGSNGSCGGTYLCTSVAGYDGPTGLGTPNGTGAF